jgi:NAD(P)-dependent dehydrogenase (short-subunit alcohol dehydrogenase family)
VFVVFLIDFSNPELLASIRPKALCGSFLPRIVVVSSLAHTQLPKFSLANSLAELNDKKRYLAQRWYGQSKLANLMFSNMLSRRLQKDPNFSHVYVNALHPGAVDTGLIRHYSVVIARFSTVLANLILRVAPYLLWDPETACLTQLFAATSPEIQQKNIRGQYLTPIARFGRPLPISADEKRQEQLWAFTESLISKAK